MKEPVPLESELKRIMGDPDGPMRFVDSIGFEVPTFIDPRPDLIPKSAVQHKRLDYHIPFHMRGDYKPEWLPRPAQLQIKGSRTDYNGFVLCAGRNLAGNRCGSRAVNRSGVCRNHGGALHPCDKMLAGSNLMVGKADPERIAELDRVQKVMQGLLPVDELQDDEIIGAFVYNDQGRPIATTKLGNRIHQQVTKELFRRMNRFMQMKLPSMLQVMTDIAESDLAEPADRIKAAAWVAERVMGKTPEVVLHGHTEAPYQSILEHIETTSRDDYRKISSQRAIEPGTDGIIDAEILSEESYSDPDEVVPDVQPDGVESESERDSGSKTNGDDPGQNGNTNGADHGINPRIPIVDPASYAQSVIEKKQAIKELRDRIAKQKRRRFAARANGATSLASAPWLIDWRVRKSGVIVGVLIPPYKQSQTVLDKIESQAIGV